LNGDEGVIAEFDFGAEAVLFLRDELLIVRLTEKAIVTTHYSFLRRDASGASLPAPPVILTVAPAAAPRLFPVLIVSSGADPGSTVLVNGAEALGLSNFGQRNIPLIGSFSVGMTIVPVAAPRGKGAIVVEYQGQKSNRFPFTVN